MAWLGRAYLDEICMYLEKLIIMWSTFHLYIQLYSDLEEQKESIPMKIELS